VKRRTLVRNVLGTTLMFVLLLAFVTFVIFGENFLDQFKAH